MLYPAIALMPALGSPAKSSRVSGVRHVLLHKDAPPSPLPSPRQDPRSPRGMARLARLGAGCSRRRFLQSPLARPSSQRDATDASMVDDVLDRRAESAPRTSMPWSFRSAFRGNQDSGEPEGPDQAPHPDPRREAVRGSVCAARRTIQGALCYVGAFREPGHAGERVEGDGGDPHPVHRADAEHANPSLSAPPSRKRSVERRLLHLLARALRADLLPLRRK